MDTQKALVLMRIANSLEQLVELEMERNRLLSGKLVEEGKFNVLLEKVAANGELDSRRDQASGSITPGFGSSNGREDTGQEAGGGPVREVREEDGAEGKPGQDAGELPQVRAATESHPDFGVVQRLCKNCGRPVMDDDGEWKHTSGYYQCYIDSPQFAPGTVAEVYP